MGDNGGDLGNGVIGDRGDLHYGSFYRDSDQNWKSWWRNLLSDAREHLAKDKGIQMTIPLPKSNSNMEAFNKKIRKIEEQMDKLSELLKNLKDSNEESRFVTKASAMKAIGERMEKDIDQVGKIARDVKAKIEAICKENLANRQKPGCGAGTGVDHCRTNMTNVVTKRFLDMMTEFQTLRQKIDDEYRDVVEKRVITVTGTRPDEEMFNHLIEIRHSEQIFQNAVKEMGRGQVLDTLEEIQERHDAVREIEKKLLDLHQIYLDMALFVESQGELLANMDSPVTNAVDHINMGTDAPTITRILQKKSRKCMIIAIFLLLVIAVLFIISIFKPWEKN
uniref:syntaxin-132-like n=1 Tax=Erigeron canadensis TaxID=72917 RepID=UPI001CB919A1|nr:syntaxin-132-like [Erigeron canadensis]